MAIEQVPATQSLMLTSGASGRINALFSARALKGLLALIHTVVILLLLPFRGRRRAAPSGSSSGHGDKGNCEKGSAGGGAKARVPANIVPWKATSSWVSAGGGVMAMLDQEVAARRTIAIRRVLQDDDPSSVRAFSMFITARGDTVFTQSWFPVSGEIRGLVVLMHGLNEHSGRYNEFAKQLNRNGFKVYGMDWIGTGMSIGGKKVACEAPFKYVSLLFMAGLVGKGKDAYPKTYRSKPFWEAWFSQNFWANFIATRFSLFPGHGGSDGLHAYVPSLDYAVSDLKSYLDKVIAENPGLPCFCFGHSTGGAIVLKAALDPKVEATLAGMVLTSPAVGVQPSHPIFAVLAPVFSVLLPRFQINAANKKGMPVSRDADALIAKYSDPLVYTGSIRVRTGYEILRASTYLQQNLNRFNVPFLVLHGSADTVTDPAGSRKLYDEASSSDKTIKLLDGYLHDLLFEPERQDIMDCIIEWLNDRV